MKYIIDQPKKNPTVFPLHCTFLGTCLGIQNGAAILHHLCNNLTNRKNGSIPLTMLLLTSMAFGPNITSIWITERNGEF